MAVAVAVAAAAGQTIGSIGTTSQRRSPPENVAPLCRSHRHNGTPCPHDPGHWDLFRRAVGAPRGAVLPALPALPALAARPVLPALAARPVLPALAARPVLPAVPAPRAPGPPRAPRARRAPRAPRAPRVPALAPRSPRSPRAPCSPRKEPALRTAEPPGTERVNRASATDAPDYRHLRTEPRGETVAMIEERWPAMGKNGGRPRGDFHDRRPQTSVFTRERWYLSPMCALSRDVYLPS